MSNEQAGKGGAERVPFDWRKPGAGMSKPAFANVCVGTMLRHTETGLHYRIRERIAGTLVLVRVSPVAHAPLVEIAKISQRGDWELAVCSKCFRLTCGCLQEVDSNG